MDLSLGSSDVWTTNVYKDVIELPADIASGNGRLIGMGIETVNTTSPLNRQGVLHSYRLPQEQGSYPGYGYQRTANVVGGVGTYTALDPFTGRQLQWVPSTEEVVTLLSGTRTWKAEEACYQPVPFATSVNPIQPMEYTQPMLVDEFQRSNLVTIGTGDDLGTTFPLTTSTATGVYYPCKWAPTHSAGQWYSGLSEATTITLTVNFYYEYFPNSKDSSLVTLATPSASYDPAALALFSELMSNLPVGVPAADNSIGAWFADCVSKFGGMVGTALTPIFGPAAAGAGMAAQQIANSYLTSQSPMTKPKVQPKQQKKGGSKPQVTYQVAKPRGPPPLPSRKQFPQQGKPLPGKLTKAEKRRLRALGVI